MAQQVLRLGGRLIGRVGVVILVCRVTPGVMSVDAMYPADQRAADPLDA